MPSIAFSKIVEEFEKPGPRYTSYPVVPVWEKSVTSEDLQNSLQTRIEPHSPLSFYLHLPFCEKLCHFCACNKVIDPRREHSERYLEAVFKEIELISKSLGGRGELIQMHWGGGTPTFYSPQDLERIFSKFDQAFRWGTSPEISIEVNPVITTVEHLDRLRSLGFNRISFGVQDFDEKVQDAINRHQTFDRTKALADHARKNGFQSLNLDLIYGLPLQTRETITKTLSQVMKIRPERIALYSYANIPWKYPFQRRFRDEDLPKGNEKINLYIAARELLVNAGYEAIGMDHFALPQDELFLAQKARKLHRNFMGYTTRGDAQMLSAGLSSISMLEDLYTQNKKTIPSYYDDLKYDRLPVELGYRLTADDKIRRWVILNLMCNFEIDLREFKQIAASDFNDYFQSVLPALNELESKALIETHPSAIKITSTGQLLVRNIAMIFDHHLQKLASSDRPLFSKTV